MTDPSDSPGADGEQHRNPPPAPQYGPAPPPGSQPSQPAMPSLVNILSMGLFALVVLQVLSALQSLWSMDTAMEQARNQAAQNPALGAEQAEAAASTFTVVFAVLGLLLAALFLWLTIMVRKGRNWARITSTVFLALGIVFGITGLSGSTGLAMALGVVMLLLEIGVLVMLWLQPSNEYFRPSGRLS